MHWRSNWYACNVRVLFCSCKICHGNANRHSPLWSVVRPPSAQGTVCAPADWRHSVRSARPPARHSTWTNCITLIGWRYRTKANTPWCCCKWLVMSGTNALSVLTSSIELFNSYCLWSSSYSLPRRLHSLLLIGSLFFSLLLLYVPWLFFLFPSSPVVLFALRFLFHHYFLFFPLFFFISYQLFMITFGSLILCLFILSHFPFYYSFSFLLFSNLLSCEYFCPWLSATFIHLLFSSYFSFPSLFALQPYASCNLVQSYKCAYSCVRIAWRWISVS